MRTHERKPVIVSPLLTEAEAIHYLRLDVDGPKHPSGTLKYYRDRGLLKAVKIGRRLRYPVWELEAFIRRLMERADNE